MPDSLTGQYHLLDSHCLELVISHHGWPIGARARRVTTGSSSGSHERVSINQPVGKVAASEGVADLSAMADIRLVESASELASLPPSASVGLTGLLNSGGF